MGRKMPKNKETLRRVPLWAKKCPAIRKGSAGSMGASKHILVTGNGFDLYHGLKTNYMDFVKCVEEAFAQPKEQRTPFQAELTQLCNVNGFFRHFHFTLADDPDWTNFEREMDNMLSALIHFQDVVLENEKDPEYDLISYNIISVVFTYNDLQIYKHFARIFEQIYDDPSGGMFKLRQQFITPEKKLNKKALIAEVRRELETFTQALDLYLSTCVMGKISTGVSPQIREIAPDYVINFNYTDTARIYGVPEDHIFYANGRAGSEPLNLVLGSPDESEEHMEWAYLRNYFQRLMRFIGVPEKSMLYPVDAAGGAVPVETHWFGYSFPATDAGLIRDLARASEKMVIYYADMEDYAYKMIRLLEVFGKETVEDQIYCGKMVFEAVR